MRPGVIESAIEGRSGDLRKGLVHSALDRLGGLGRDLLCQCAEFLALLRQRLELLAGVGVGQFDDFRQRLAAMTSPAKSNAALVFARAASITLRP